MPTLVCTGCSSGLGLQAIRQLVSHPAQRGWRIIIGARNVAATRSALKQFVSEDHRPQPEVLKLDLESFESVKEFAKEVKALVEDAAAPAILGAPQMRRESGVQCMLLNAGVYTSNFIALQGGWCKEAVVNHFCRFSVLSGGLIASPSDIAQLTTPLRITAQHFLLLLLSSVLKPSKSILRPRLVITSSALHLQVPIDSIPDVPEKLKSRATPSMTRYKTTKLTQMINAHYWKSIIGKDVDVVAISPGFVPSTGLNRESSVWTRFFLNWALGWFSFVSSIEKGGRAISSSIPPSTPKDVEEPPITAWLGESIGEETVLYIDVNGKKVAPHPAILQQGKHLWEKWSPSIETMEKW